MKLIGALKAAKRTAPFYSAVDEALAAIKRPKGTGAEFYTELTKQAGVKKAELADRKLEQAFKAKGKMTKEEAQQVLADNPPPQLKEKVYDESTAIDEADLREMVSQEMFGMPYSEIGTGGAWHRVSDEVYRRMNDDLGTKYGKYKTPDGENYREILLKLPQESSKITEAEKNFKLARNTWEKDPTQQNYAQMQMAEQEREVAKITSASYRSGHWEDDANVLAHMRVQDRKGPNGEKILHVEEIQSDWHQAGRKKGYKPDDYIEQSNALDKEFKDLVNKRGQLRDEAERIGYRGEGHKALVEEANSITPRLMQLQEQRDKMRDVINYGVPNAPFKKNWHELAMKRLLNYAADNDYDSIAITPGAEQAKRFDLSKQINTISWNKQSNGLYGIEADTVEGRPIIKKGLTEQELEDTVGKEVANRIVNGVGQFANDPLFDSGKLTRGKLENLDLKVGGEGMMGFYDKMLPDYLNNFGKSYGAQVGTFDIPNPKPNKGINDLAELLRQRGMTDEQYANLPQQERVQLLNEVKEANASQMIPLHNFPITPEMRESIKQKGLPLYQQVGIPTAGAGAASQALQPEEEAGLATGGVVKSAIKQAQLAKLAKLREQMAPRAEAVKALIARDENRYLADVAPNSLTNAEIEAEIKRMAAKAPMFMKPSALTELRKIVQQEKGDYGSRRLERAADEVPNLEKMYTLDALKERFLGDNAKALMTMSPADFEKFATELQGKTSVGPKAAESAKQGDISKYTVPTSDYVKHLERIAMFDSVPYLNLAKEEVGLPLLPYISGHEGRHRSRALAGRGEKSNLVGITPTMDLREGLPRRSQEEFIEAMKKELELSGGLVLPESEPMLGGRPPIILPDVYAKGGAVKPKVKDSKSGKVRMTENRDTMFMELSNKKLKRK